MTKSTPDALWASRSVRLLRPAAAVCRGLRRSVGGVPLLDGLDLAVPVGARLLIVSEPEASASLLLRILAGLVHADGGQMLLAGVRRADESAQGWARRIGYAGPHAQIHAWLSPQEVLDLAGRLIGLPDSERHARVEAMAGRVGLSAVQQRPMRRGGPEVAQRVALAAALLSDPEVLLLDEPLRAVESGERARLLRLPRARATVLLASRYPASEAGLVDSVALLRNGRLVLHASVRKLAEHGLPLSRRGIEALAEMRSPARQPPAQASTAGVAAG